MNIYIGYKYRNFKDKEGLKENLSKISDAISSLGHKTFILGRDEFEWNHHGSPSGSIIPIVKNLKNNDVFFAIVECDNRSNGLLFESIFSKLLGKKMILAIKKDLKGKPFKMFARNTIEFDSYEDLVNIIRSDFDKYL